MGMARLILGVCVCGRSLGCIPSKMVEGGPNRKLTINPPWEADYGTADKKRLLGGIHRKLPVKGITTWPPNLPRFHSNKSSLQLRLMIISVSVSLVERKPTVSSRMLGAIPAKPVISLGSTGRRNFLS